MNINYLHAETAYYFYTLLGFRFCAVGQNFKDMFNLVEMVAGDDEQSFNQKCKFGNLVNGHAVYCHSDNPDAPRKCRRTWYYGKDEKGMQDEDCPYYELNPNYKCGKANEA